MSDSPPEKTVFFLNILRDGAGMINRELGFAGELHRRGHQVEIISYFKPEGGPVPEGVPVHTLMPSRYRDILYKPAVAFPLLFPRLLMLLRRIRPTRVSVDLAGEAWWALLMRRFFHYELVFTYHGVADSKFYADRLAAVFDRERALSHARMRKADRVVVVSDFLLAEAGRAGVPGALRLWNGVDPIRCSPEKSFTGLKSERPLVLFVGRYTEYKGALNVVKAFALARKKIPDAVLMMRGYFERPEYEAEMRRVIESEGMQEDVLLFGPLDGEEMIRWINLADVFINGSLDETFCMPLLEAQACGVACTAFAAGGIPEVVSDGRTGLLAPPGEIDAMAENLVRLLGDPALREQMGEAGRAHAAAYAYPVLTDDWLKVMEAPL